MEFRRTQKSAPTTAAVTCLYLKDQRAVQGAQTEVKAEEKAKPEADTKVETNAMAEAEEKVRLEAEAKVTASPQEISRLEAEAKATRKTNAEVEIDQAIIKTEETVPGEDDTEHANTQKKGGGTQRPRSRTRGNSWNIVGKLCNSGMVHR